MVGAHVDAMVVARKIESPPLPPPPRPCEAASEALRVAVKHVVLGALAGGEAHGYAVARAVSAALLGEQPVEASRVYQILNELRRSGLVLERSAASGRHGRMRRVYRLSARGEAAYRRWLHAPARASTVLRRPVLVRIALASLMAEVDLEPWRAALRLRESELRRLAESSKGAGELARTRARLHLQVEVETLRALIEAELTPRAAASTHR